MFVLQNVVFSYIGIYVFIFMHQAESTLYQLRSYFGHISVPVFCGTTRPQAMLLTLSPCFSAGVTFLNIAMCNETAQNRALFAVRINENTHGKSGRQQLGRYSDSTGAGRSGDRIPVGARFFAPVQSGPGFHIASCTVVTVSFPGVKRPRRGVDYPQ